VPSHPVIPFFLNSEVVGRVKREFLRFFEGEILNDEIAGRLVALAMNWVTDETQDLAVRYLYCRLLKSLVKFHEELQLELNSKIDLYRLKNGRFL
jgi:hypothetical protein